MKAFALVSLAGVIGIYLGAMLNMEGYLGIVFSIAAATAILHKPFVKEK